MPLILFSTYKVKYFYKNLQIMENLIEKTDKLKDLIKCLEVLKAVASEQEDHSDIYILKSAETIVGGLAARLADELRYDVAADVAESQSYLQQVDDAIEAAEAEEMAAAEEEPEAEPTPTAEEQIESEEPAEPSPEIASVREQAKEFFGNSDIFVEKDALETIEEAPAEEPTPAEEPQAVVETPETAVVEEPKPIIEEPQAKAEEPAETVAQGLAERLEQMMAESPAPATQEEQKPEEEYAEAPQETNLREQGFFERKHTNSDIFKSISESRPQPSTQQQTQAEPSKPKIKSIKAATSAANRFIFQRELFGGNGENMLKALDKLDEMDSLQDAMAFIQNELNLDQENRATKELIELVKKRF